MLKTIDGCIGVSELLEAYADGALHGQEARRVAEHVQHCASCAADLHAAETVLRALRSLPGQAGPRDKAFWNSMAAEITATTAKVTAPRRWYRGAMGRSFLAGGGLAAAAVLAFVLAMPQQVERLAAPSVDGSLSETVTGLADELQSEGTPHRTLFDELGIPDSDPLDMIDDLDDNDLQAVGAEFTDGV